MNDVALKAAADELMGRCNELLARCANLAATVALRDAEIVRLKDVPPVPSEANG